MKELMVHIEKAVRPLRATQSHRRKVRQELLEHLQGVYEEEIERLGDHDLAVKSAITRFGPADELSHQLRAALPWHNLVLSCIPLFAPVRHWPISVFRVGLSAWTTGILFWLFSGVPWCWSLVSSGRNSVVEALLLWNLFALAGAALLWPTFGIIGAIHGVYRQPKSRRRAILYGGTQYLMLVAIYICVSVVAKGVVPQFSIFGTVAPAIVPVSIALASTSRAFRRAIQLDEERGTRTCEWEKLELS